MFNADREARIAARLAEDDARQIWLAELDENYTTNPNTGLMTITEKGLAKMARTPGAKNKPKGEPKANPKSAGLLAALEFVAVAGSKSEFAYQTHVTLLGNMAMMFDGQMAAGHPIAEGLSCCPHFDRLTAALRKAGGAVSITELDIHRLRIKGDKMSATVPCLPDLQASMSVPDPSIAVIDDRLKVALGICGTLVSEAAETVMGASVLLGAQVCTSTNRAVMFQAFHGIDLPPNMLVPKLFTAAVCKQEKPLTGFGLGYKQDGTMNSITFWFEGGAWIKTQLYEDLWPVENIPAMMDIANSPAGIPFGFFEGVAAVSEFTEDNNFVYLVPGAVQSHPSSEVGAQYPVEGIAGGKILDAKFLKLAAPFATSIDFDSNENRVVFFGEGMRGVIACVEPGDIVLPTAVVPGMSFVTQEVAEVQGEVWADGPTAYDDHAPDDAPEQAPASVPGTSWND